MKNTTLWITRTAVFIALLIAWQAASAALGNQFVTGSGVNLILIVSVMICGVASGSCVALVSPVMAKMFGIGPLWGLIPFIALGNLAIVLVWHIVGNRTMGGKFTAYTVAAASGAVAKFLTLYLGIVKLAIPVILKIPEPQATVMSGMFSIPQLITALIGGSLAVILLPTLKKVAGNKDK